MCRWGICKHITFKNAFYCKLALFCCSSSSWQEIKLSYTCLNWIFLFWLNKFGLEIIMKKLSDSVTKANPQADKSGCSSHAVTPHFLYIYSIFQPLNPTDREKGFIIYWILDIWVRKCNTRLARWIKPTYLVFFVRSLAFCCVSWAVCC